MRKYGKLNIISTVFVLLLITIFLGWWGEIPDGIFPSANEQNQKASGNLNEWTVHFLDVGQGDCILVKGPDGSILIDGGNPENGNDIIQYIRQQGIQTIETLVVTHPHSDHIGGLKDVINTIPIKNIYMPKIYHNTSKFLNLLKTIEKKGYRIKEAKADISFPVGSTAGASAVFLGPVRNDYDDVNNHSAVLQLKIKNVIFLFMGDAEKEAENDLKGKINADVLKVGHHGSDSSTGKDFLKRVNPSVAVISVGKKNEYKHPDKKVIDRLEKNNTTIYTTAKHGTVVIFTDGKSYKVLE